AARGPGAAARAGRRRGRASGSGPSCGSRAAEAGLDRFGRGAEALRLGLDRSGARAREPEVAPAAAVDDLLAIGLDQPLIGEALQRAVERPGGEPHPLARQLPGLLRDRVPVLGAVEQAREDEQRLLGHARYYISAAD